MPSLSKSIRAMHGSARYILSAAVLCLLAASPIHGAAQTTPTAPCVLGYTVGFFNGVWNTELEAMDGMNGLQDAIRQATFNDDDTYNNEDVGYQLFYNHTGSTVGAGKWQDVAEVFVQRANSLDPTGALAQGGFESVWEFLNTGGGGIVGIMTSQSPALQSLVNQFVSDFITAATQAVGYYTANPPTAVDYAAQDNELTTLAAAERRLLLVAHSQGNLFVDPAYDFIQPVVGSTRVKAVQIAPASPTVRGQYMLSDNDLVINALRLQGGPSTVQPNNIDISISPADYSGHTLVATYLDASRNGRAMAQAMLTAGLAALTAPSTCQIGVTPQSTNLPVGTSQLLTATINPPPGDNLLSTEYQWSVTGNAGGTLNGGVTSLNTSSSSVTYQASATAPQAAIDKVSVTVLVAKLAGDYVNAATLGTGSATLSIVPATVPVTASPASIPIGGSSSLTPNLSSYTNTNNYSYLWTTSGAYGGLNGTGSTVAINSSGNVTSVCATTPQNTYTSNANATFTAAVTDTVTVGVFSAPGCPSSNSAGSGTTSVTVTPAGGLQNGDFSSGLTGWTQFTSSSPTQIFINTSCYYMTQDDYPAQEGNPFVEMLAAGAKGNPFGYSYAYIQQTFKVPATATTLSLRAWDQLDPVIATISIIDSNGNLTVLDSFTPPPIQKLSDPNNPYSVVGTGNTSVTKTYGISSYAGQTITLRLEADGVNNVENGYFLNYDDVSVQ